MQTRCYTGEDDALLATARGRPEDVPIHHWNTLVERKLSTFPLYVHHDRKARTTPLVTRSHRQPGLEIHVAHLGNGALAIGHGLYRHRPRQVILFDGEALHQILGNDVGYRRTTLCIDPQALRCLLPPDDRVVFDTCKLLHAHRYPVAVEPEDWETVEQVCLQMTQLEQHRPPWWQTHLLALFARFIAVLESTARASVCCPEVEAAPIPDWLESCRRYVVNNLATDLSLRQVAALAFVRPEHLTRAFKRRFGISFYRFVLSQRIDAACRLLLEEPCRPVSEVAKAVGFTSVPHFNRKFRQMTGLSPTAFRRLAPVERLSH